MTTLWLLVVAGVVLILVEVAVRADFALARAFLLLLVLSIL